MKKAKLFVSYAAAVLLSAAPAAAQFKDGYTEVTSWVELDGKPLKQTVSFSVGTKKIPGSCSVNLADVAEDGSQNSWVTYKIETNDNFTLMRDGRDHMGCVFAYLKNKGTRLSGEICAPHRKGELPKLAEMKFYARLAKDKCGEALKALGQPAPDMPVVGASRGAPRVLSQ